MKRYIRYLMILFLLVFAVNTTTITAEAAVKINLKEKTIYVGSTCKLKITGTKKSVKWSSSKKKVATVNSSGKVTAKKAGTATITAKVGNKKYTCKITVKNPSLNEKKLTLTKGNKFNLKLSGTKAVKWTSSNSKIVTVNKKGKITAKKVGNATISVKAKNGKTYKCKVTVENETTTPTEPSTPVNHTHSYTLIESKSPTCTEQGYNKYKCVVCGDTYQNTFPTIAHAQSAWIEDVHATCETNGHRYKMCYICKNILEEETIPALGHNYVSKVIAPTCTEKGYTLYTCTRDGHSYKDKFTNATGHNYVLTKTVEATCTTDGYKEYTCSKCGDSYKEIITKLGHDYHDEVIAPTCTEQGYTLHTCTRDGSSYKDEYKEALGHDYGEGVIDIEATDYSLGYKIYTCKNCGESVRMPYALPHEIDLGNGQTTTIYGYWDMDMANEIFTMLNEYRLENNLYALESEESVNEYAKTRALELAYLYGHIRPDGYLTALGENIASTKETSLEFMTAWKNSPGHNSAMLGTSDKYGAVGVFYQIWYENSTGDVKSVEFSNETFEYHRGNFAVQNFDF